MYNFSDEGVHFGRRDCSTSAARGVQLERYIQSSIFRKFPYRIFVAGIECHYSEA